MSMCDKPFKDNRIYKQLIYAFVSKPIYDRVSDVVESCVRFANKILTHHRMH